MTRESFRCFARAVDNFTAHPVATAVAFSVIFAWAFVGRYFHYSDTWQLIVNTLSSVVTFLMVFIIANAQKRDNDALNVKLDALLAANAALSKAAVGVELATEEQLEELRAEIAALASTTHALRFARERIEKLPTESSHAVAG